MVIDDEHKITTKETILIHSYLPDRVCVCFCVACASQSLKLESVLLGPRSLSRISSQISSSWGFFDNLSLRFIESCVQSSKLLLRSNIQLAKSHLHDDAEKKVIGILLQRYIFGNVYCFLVIVMLFLWGERGCSVKIGMLQMFT